MQYGSFEVRFEGKTTNTVVKNNVTPAEYEILCQLHGPEAVEPIHITHEAKTSNDDEIERLSFVYNTKNGHAAFKSVFPGSRPRLPVRFSDVGLDAMRHADEGKAQVMEKTGMTLEEAQAIIEAAKKDGRLPADKPAATRAGRAPAAAKEPEADKKEDGEGDAGEKKEDADEGKKDDDADAKKDAESEGNAKKQAGKDSKFEPTIEMKHN